MTAGLVRETTGLGTGRGRGYCRGKGKNPLSNGEADNRKGELQSYNPYKTTCGEAFSLRKLPLSQENPWEKKHAKKIRLRTRRSARTDPTVRDES